MVWRGPGPGGNGLCFEVKAALSGRGHEAVQGPSFERVLPKFPELTGPQLQFLGDQSPAGLCLFCVREV